VKNVVENNFKQFFSVQVFNILPYLAIPSPLLVGTWKPIIGCSNARLVVHDGHQHTMCYMRLAYVSNHKILSIVGSVD
jgi:hypothetical protein